MTKLVPVQLEDGVVLYIEAQDGAETVRCTPLSRQKNDEFKRVYCKA